MRRALPPRNKASTSEQLDVASHPTAAAEAQQGCCGAACRSHTAGGWSLDFARLLVNRKRQNTCKGTVRGRVVEKDTEAPITGARVSLGAVTDAEGAFTVKDVPTGFEVVTASASGFADGSGAADIAQGKDNPDVVIRLARGKALQFAGVKLELGKALQLNTILFDVGKADLKKDSKPELEKLAAFMKENPGAEIELSGHTSSEGDAAQNRSLSYRRVKACKDWVIGKGIDPGRIIAVGFA